MSPARPPRVWGRRLAAAVVMSAIAVFAPPVPVASAHATLLFTTPTADGAVPVSPKALELVFDQTVVSSASSLKLSDTEGKTWPIEQVESGRNGRTVTARVPMRLPFGQYLVRWQVTADDGDSILGEYTFAVGSICGLSLASGTTGGVSLTLAILRWALFSGLALALGGLVGQSLARRHASEVRTPEPWAGWGLLLGGAASTGLALTVVGAGSIGNGFAASNIATLLSSTPGRLAAAEVLAFVVAAALLCAKHQGLAGSVLLLVPLSEGLRAHPEAAAAGLGGIVTAFHLTAAAVWAGALVQVLRVCRSWRKQQQPTLGLVASYARLAVWLFTTVVVTGAVEALLLIPVGEVTSILTHTAYGRWLLAKLAVVAVVATLAVSARSHLRRRSAERQPSRAASVEVVALGAVLGISGLLTALAPPVRGDLPLPFPPPPVGPVVALGSRAGFIGVGVTASTGQLVIHLTAPETSPGGASSETRYQLAGNTSGRGIHAPTELRFRACGQGCFVAPVPWSPGATTVTLRVGADTWTGGTTAVNFAWPPQPARGRLKQVVHTMGKVRRFSLHERVTSNTAQGLGDPRVFALTGPGFLSSEPYGSGTASSVTLIAESTTQTTLALAYPAEDTHVLLTIGRDDRITHERLTTANELVSRSFVYPEGTVTPHADPPSH